MSDHRTDAALPGGHGILEAGPVSLASGIAGWIRAGRSATASELGKVALVGGAYYVAAILSLRVALVGGQVTPIWPPTGIAVAGILLFGRKVWPAIAFGAFLVNAPIGPSPLTAVGIAVGNTVAPLLCATLLQKAGFRPQLDRLRDAVALVSFGTLSMTVSATCGTATLLLWGSIPFSQFWPTWSVWWAGDAMGVFIVAPFLLGLRSTGPRSGSWRRRAEAGLLFGGLAVVSYFGLTSPYQARYLVFPFLAWAAWRFRQRGAALAALVASATAVWTAVERIGPFRHEGLVERMISLQVFNATVALASIVLAALVSERRRAEEELRRSQEWVNGLLVSAPGAILVVREDGRIVLANPRAEQIFGYEHDELIDRPVETLVPKSLRDAHVRHRADYLKDPAARPMGLGLGLELAGRRKDGTEFPVEIGLSSFGPPRARMVTCIISDITERKRAEEGLARQALHDPLTDLANRTLFMDKLSQALSRSERQKSLVAVLFLDLDHFKVINDNRGHEVGDTVLVRMAARLRTALRPEDTASRFGGDEFVVLLEDIENERHAVDIADRLARSVAEPIELEGGDIVATTSVGIAVAQGTAESPEAVVRDADAAVYRAKERGRARYELFDRAMRKRAAKRLRTETDLRRAIEHGQLRLDFQPLVDIDDGRIRSVEALVRWDHPERGLLLPEEFIPVAEETGLIGPLGSWVLEEACQQASTWCPSTPEGTAPSISVNLSAGQLARPDFEDTVARVLDETRVDSSRLIFEITETVLMERAPSILDILRRLREIGVHLAIDDFGTGYSSLHYLKRFSVDALKVDRSFVKDLGSNLDDSAIVGAVVSLAHSLGLFAIAEGVETKKQLSQLRRLGCDLAQGFYFAPPQPADELAENFGLRRVMARS
jgi:diguanylate cyclase (GGDEF)-like protein/PAS domain S-box-containing protein